MTKPKPHPAPGGDLPTAGPSTSPKKALDPSRVHGSQQPPNLREAFNEFYPNGLPNVYKMLQTPGTHGVPQTYLEDYLLVGFYTNPRIEAGAIFSTQCGEKPFRKMDQLMPQRRVHLWNKDEIQSVCNSLRRLYWNHMKYMQKPSCWDDLWTYFDTCDLYNYGAMNLWNVVNHLYHENQIIAEDVRKTTAVEVGLWADTWVYKESNCQALKDWDETKGPLMALITQEDWKLIGSIHSGVITLIESAFTHRRSLLLAPEKLRLGSDVKPNHLMKSCADNSLENWLAGQRIFEPSGLPPAPATSPHQASPTSKKASAPVHVINGKHYYQSPSGKRVPSAVEVLNQSAAAAGPVAHNNSDAVLTEQTEMVNSEARETLRVSHQTRCKSTEPSHTVPSPPSGNEEKDQAASNSSAKRKKKSFKKQRDTEEFDVQTPTKAGRRGYGNPRATTGARKSTVTTSLPTSTVMEFSTLRTPEKQTNSAQATLSPSKEDDASRNGKQRDAESQADASKKPKRNQRLNQYSAGSGPQEHKSIPSLGEMNTLNRLQRLDPNLHTNHAPGVYAEGLVQPNQMHNPLGISFHPSGTFNHVVQSGQLAPQDSASNSSSYRHASMQQPFLHSKSFLPNRGRNPSNSSRLDRPEPNDNRWYQNNENLNKVNSGFNRGGYQRGGRKGTGRRGGHNQRNATAPVTQPYIGSDSIQKVRDGGPWKNKWRREGTDPIQVTCKNVQDGFAIRDYVPCSCQMCEARNRSVHVAVEAHHEISSIDMQSRIKFGLSERHGLVDEVYPLPSKEPGRFIVRFTNPSSVAEALTMGGGNMPEHALSVTFTPDMRSKWTLSEQAPTRVTPSQALDQHSSSMPFSSYPFGLVAPGNAPGVAAAHQIPPGMLHPSVANPANAHIWPRSGGQQAFSGFAQPHVLDRPTVAPQPTTDLPHFVPTVRGYSQNQTSVPGPTQLETVGQILDEPLKTKPPAEEALEDIHRNDRCDSYSPKSDGNGTDGTKARISLPNTPSKASLSTKEAHAIQPTATEKSAGNQASAEVVPRLPHTATSVPGRSVTSHNRVPSAFTENEIKERRQAWAKIPMPLNPYRSRNPTPTKPSSGPIEDGENSRVSKGDKREAYAAASELSTPTQNVTFTPDTGSIYEQSPGKQVSPTCAQKDSSALSSSEPTGQETTAEENIDQDQELATASSQIGKTVCQSESDQVQVLNPIEQDVPLQVSDKNLRPDNAQATQPKGKGKGSKPKPKSKKKKSKHKMMSQGNESNSHTSQQVQISSPPLVRPTTQAPQDVSGSVHRGPSSIIVFDDQSSEPFSPTKRHHDDPEQRSASGFSKQSKKHGNTQEITLDESDSPDEDARGRKGFRVGRGGSLRMGKTRRPRAIMTVSALAEQPTETQVSPPSSDFAFQCQNASTSAGSPSRHGPDNSAMSRLNPKAQEFVSPSRVAPIDKQIASGSSGNEIFDRPASEDTTNRTQNVIQEPLKSNLGVAPMVDTMLSAADTSTPKYRRTLSEAAQKETSTNDKEGTCQDQAKTLGKGPKRAKGKERAATVGAQKEKAEGTEGATQDSPRTPKLPGTRTRKPGLISDDWPTLPASRDRAPSKPQTPPIWGTKTKPVVENAESGEGSPVTKG
ncbi:hypothetical protein FLAG1_01885 [Fusarium langsethiae]|uniref:Cbr-clec-223 protein n=1 Tax=Fusarium langsethiae TaxID=179993 RepID=A0A0N0DH92_FUSLA|nr:hypothetical protein FLAG1_01885 [Fusarium langsethiae]GKT99852.1 unnamed protein product [Fusarium langsethiae]